MYLPKVPHGTTKTKTTKQTVVETGHALSLHTEQKNYAGTQNENLQENQAENKTTEIITAESLRIKSG